MKVKASSLVIGIAIGAVAITIPSVFILTLTANNERNVPTFFVGGYLVDISADDNSMTLTQTDKDFWLENDYVRTGDMKIVGGSNYGCGLPDSDSLPLSICGEKFRAGEIPAWTVVCANVRLENGELRGGKIFLEPRTQGCNIPSQQPISSLS
jgi:hypothetical protein